MPSKVATRARPKKNGHTKLSSATSSTTTTSKVSFVVLLFSCALFYAYYDQQQRPHDQQVTTQLDRLIGVITETVQQWSKLVASKARTLFGFSVIRPDSVLRGLLSLESSVPIRTDSSIAIGLGACTDLVVESLEIFNKFAAPSSPRPHLEIETMQDLLELFAYYFKHGAASE